LEKNSYHSKPYFVGYEFDALLTLTSAFEKLEKSSLKKNCSTNFSIDSIWQQSCWRIELLDIIKNLDIEGVTGRIRFHNGDRIGEIVIEQILGIFSDLEKFSSICEIFKIDFSIS
jgi:hypothetical protein